MTFCLAMKVKDGIVGISGRSENGDLLLADGCDVSDKFRDLGEHGSRPQPGFELRNRGEPN